MSSHYSEYARFSLFLSNGIGSPIQIVQVRFAPKARVAFETSAHQPLVHQQIWMLQGRMQVTLGKDTHTLETGDCFAMVLDRPLSYYNPTGRTAHYAVVLCSAAKF